jgi:hypothetical protein
MIEIPHKFAGKPPVNPESRKSGQEIAMHYRELTVWQMVMKVAKEVYRLAPRLPREETYGMRSQITRAAASVPCQYSGGMDPGVGPGEGSLSGNCVGIACRDENIPDPVREDRLVSDDGNGAAQGFAHGSGKMLTVLRRNFRNNG